MAQTLDFESDQFLQLLTDALRAGPGTPAWHQAVRQLETGGMSPDAKGADQYRMLVTAREHLESGKSYRSIRPGPAFTRKVLGSIEAESNDQRTSGHGRFSVATWIAIVASLAGIAAVSVVGFLLSTGGDRQENVDLQALALQSFDHPITGLISFDRMPEGWKPMGTISVKADHGLRVVLPGKLPGYGGGGIYRLTDLPVDGPCEVDLDVRYTAGAGVVPELFITDRSPDTFNQSGVTPHELVWTLLNDQPQVEFPDQTFVPVGTHISKKAVLHVRIKLDNQYAIIETIGANGGRWMGVHQLAADERHVGIRFLVRNTKLDHDVSVESFHLSQP